MFNIGDLIVVEVGKHGFYAAKILELKSRGNLAFVRWESRWDDSWVTSSSILPADSKRPRRSTDRYLPVATPTPATTSSPRKKSKSPPTDPVFPANFEYLGIRASSFDVGSLVFFGTVGEQKLVFVGNRKVAACGPYHDIIVPTDNAGNFLFGMSLLRSARTCSRNIPSLEGTSTFPSFDLYSFGDVGYAVPVIIGYTPTGGQKESCWFTGVISIVLDGGDNFIVVFPFDMTSMKYSRTDLLSFEHEFTRTVTNHKVSPVPSVFQVNEFPMYPRPVYEE